MATRGRPKKQPVTQRIENALGAAKEEIDKKMPKDVQNALVPVDTKAVVALVDQAPKISKEARDDYDFARSNLHALLLKGNEILEGITNLAQESDHPRTYEVAGGVVKVLIDGTRELMQLQKDIREIEKKTGGSDEAKPVTIENADQVNNFVMDATTLELLESLEEIKKRKQQKSEGTVIDV